MITHGSNGEYGHPAHVVTYQAAVAAVASFGDRAPLLYTVAASFPEHPKPFLSNKFHPPHVVIDVTRTLGAPPAGQFVDAASTGVVPLEVVTERPAAPVHLPASSPRTRGCCWHS